MTIERVITNYREITSAEFGSFLTAKGISPKCPSCGDISAINVKGEGELVSPLAYTIVSILPDGKSLDADSSVIAASISCQNCGYMRTFNYSAILKWLDAQQHGAGSNNE